MRCDICGGEIPWHREALDTKNDPFNEPSPNSMRRDSTKTVGITLCPACANNRAVTRNTLFGIAIVLSFVIIACALWRFIP